MTSGHMAQDRFLDEIASWLNKKTSSSELAEKLGMTREWIDELEIATDNYRAAIARGGAGTAVTLEPPTGGDPVADDDEVLVVLDHVVIRRLFTDSERTERDEQEGTVYFDVNGQTTTLSWKRPKTGSFPRTWADYTLDQKTLLYAGPPKGALDFDVIVTESDEPEREFFQRISDLLLVAARFAGFLPGQAGSAVSASLNLGAAVAQLIKAQLQDDAEMRFLGTVGGSRLNLVYGTYLLKRHSQGGTSPEIEMQIRVAKFVKTHLPTGVKIFLDRLVFVRDGSNVINNLDSEDRVLVDMTVTETPEDQKETPRIGSLKVDRPYFGENGADWPKTFEVRDKLIYDGKWGLNIALNLNLSGVPRNINEEEWMAVIQQTGALVGAVADPESQASIRRGFEIAEALRATVVKFLPKTRFSSTLSTALFVGAVIDGLYALQQNTDWQEVEITLDLGRFGKARFHLRVKLTF